MTIFFKYLNSQIIKNNYENNYENKFSNYLIIIININ